MKVSRYRGCFVASFVLYISCGVATAFADEYEALRNEIEKKNEEYNHVSCMQGKAEHSAQLTYEEICKYGQECPRAKQKQLAYCRETLLSQCFTKKAWLTSNNFFGLPDSVPVENTSTHQRVTMKDGKVQKIFLHCAYYN